jgi:fumarylacetoacetase
MHPLDETHDPERRSWVDSANGHADFPIQNLPYARFSVAADSPRPGFALGDKVIDVARLVELGLLDGAALEAARKACSAPNALIGLHARERSGLRRSLSTLFADGHAQRAKAADALHDAARCTFHLPADIGDYTDFNAGIHHAANGGRRRGLKDPVLPNYRHIPIAYHARASSVRPSGVPVRRPNGQTRPAEPGASPGFGPSAKLDFELELGIWIAEGNEHGTTIPIRGAHEHIAGYSLLNDWSARDIQSWESERLGPFLGKSFVTTVSPWVITPEALAPFRHAAFERAPGEPAPLPYLDDPQDRRHGALAMALEVWLSTQSMRARGAPARRIVLSDSRHLYWTPAQMVAHHASNGCNLRPGDLLGTGTISGPEPEAFGSMLELSWDGAKPFDVDGETRRFLEDGDEVTLRARAQRDGFVSIGFGECAGRIAGSAS